MICKLEGKYFIYSPVVDSATTYPMTLDELTEYIRERHGSEGLRELPARLERVEKNGTSARAGDSPENLLFLNRAGCGESELSMEQWRAWARGEVKELSSMQGVKHGGDPDDIC